MWWGNFGFGRFIYFGNQDRRGWKGKLVQVFSGNGEESGFNGAFRVAQFFLGSYFKFGVLEVFLQVEFVVYGRRQTVGKDECMILIGCIY